MTESSRDWKARVEELSGARLRDCYQCGKCTAGCPRGDAMDMPPTLMMRKTQNGDILEAARATSIWKCVSCLTCSARCPKSVEVAGVVDALRQIAVETNNLSSEAAKTIAFQKAFLRNVRRNGRTNELEMVADFEIRHFLRRFDVLGALKDATAGPKMMAKSKLHFKIGSPVKDKALVKRIFQKCGVEI
ncbi:MAG: 4Fe-4S dicluster domain-containing protein [Thermoguttaceae bacterium]|nr:4Fe-4S dicluster domain-containing protein [Thermoguttaceae bacterium]